MNTQSITSASTSGSSAVRPQRIRNTRTARRPRSWLSLAPLLLVASLASAAHAQTYDPLNGFMLDNGVIRFGGLGHNSTTYETRSSVVGSGMTQQPHYRSQSGVWYKLTFAEDLPLSMTVGTGTGGSNWTGSTVPATGSFNTQIGLLDLASLAVDGGGMTITRTVGGVQAGYGTLIVSGTVTVNGQEMGVRHSYQLGQNDAFVRVTTRITNNAPAAMNNVNLWMGTRDDWVGNSDGPRKTRGNIVAGSFAAISQATDASSALLIETGAEAVLFYSTTPNVNAVWNSCCTFNNAYNQNPSTNPPISSFADGSYAIHLPVGDLAPGASRELTWFYAAGALADINNIIRSVAQASGAVSDITDVSAALGVSSSQSGTGYWMVVPAGSAVPTAQQLEAGVAYAGVTPVAAGNLALTANVASTIALSPLQPGTAYTVHFVIKTLDGGDVVYSALVSENFTTRWRVSTSISANGMIDPTERLVVPGQTTTFALTPTAGYAVSSATGCGGSLSGTTYTTGAISAACTVTVAFAPAEYTLTLNPQGGSVTPTSKTVVYGSAIGSLPTPVRSGFSFQAWSTTAAVGGQFWTAETVYNVAGNTTLYARWIPGPTNLNYAASDPTVFSVGGSSATPTIDLGGGVATYTITAPSTVPAGITIDAATGVVSWAGTLPVGTYDLTITATTASGSTTAPFRIVVTVKPLSGVTIDAIPDEMYTGSARTPAVVVRNGATTLVLGVDYTAAYQDNVLVGTATVTLTGTGNYSSTTSTTFQIVAAPPTDLSYVDPAPTVFGTGGSVLVRTLYLGGGVAAFSITAPNPVPAGITINPVTGEVRWTGTTPVGTYHLTITATTAGGSTTAPLVITVIAKDLNALTVGAIEDQIYTNAMVEPPVLVTDGGTVLTRGVDYTLAYRDNVAVGTATVIVTGIGNYTGVINTTFRIVAARPASLSYAASAPTVFGAGGSSARPAIFMGGSVPTYSITAPVPVPPGISIDPVTGVIRWSAELPPGTYDLTITATTAVGSVTAPFRIEVTTTPLTVLTVDPIEDQTFSGSARTPAVVVRNGATTLVLGVDYTVTYQDNIEAGTATVVITGIGRYAGTRTITFRIAAPALRLTLTSSTVSPAIGDTVTMTLTVHNDGNGEATDIVIPLPLDPRLQFLSTTPSIGTVDPTTNRWRLPVLRAGDAQQLTIRAVVRAGTNTP